MRSNGILLGTAGEYNIRRKIDIRIFVEVLYIVLNNDQFKDNQMRSLSLLSGQKFRKAYFEASNPKKLKT